MRKKTGFLRWISFTRVEIVNLVIALIGILMIVYSTLTPAENESVQEKMLALIGDLGIGLFPTGIIGFFLERIQNRNEDREKNNKRLAILRLINNAIHGYLNVICNSAIKQKSQLKLKTVFEIVDNLNEGLFIEKIDGEAEALAILVDRLRMSFGSTDPLFIVADVFETIEIKYFESLLQDGESLLQMLDMSNGVSKKRNSFLSYVKIACSEIPECKGFVDMISDGDNIFVPNSEYMLK